MNSHSYFIAIRRKIPPFRSISSLYATIVVLVGGWTTFAFLWKLPSWLYYMDLGQIAVLWAYVVVVSLFESLTFLFLFLLASTILPSRWLYSQFIVRGSILIYSLTFWVALFDFRSGIELPTRADVLALAIGFPLTAGLGILLADRIPSIKRFLISLANRLVIFLYLWTPISFIAILIVIFRLA